jgi:hypothetical protein
MECCFRIVFGSSHDEYPVVATIRGHVRGSYDIAGDSSNCLHHSSNQDAAGEQRWRLRWREYGRQSVFVDAHLRRNALREIRWQGKVFVASNVTVVVSELAKVADGGKEAILESRTIAHRSTGGPQGVADDRPQTGKLEPRDMHAEA